MKRRPKRNRAKLFFLLFLVLVCLVLAFLFFSSGTKEKIRTVARERAGSTVAPTPEEVSKRRVTLFFLSENDDLLHPEEREIVSSSSPVAEAREIIGELLAGSHQGYLSPLPPETKLRQIFLVRDGTAYVDFSREFVDRHPSGSSAEMATIYAIVNSLTQNVPQIKQVFFLVEGGERETLSGHINLNRPFSAFPSLIAR